MTFGLQGLTDPQITNSAIEPEEGGKVAEGYCSSPTMPDRVSFFQYGVKSVVSS